MKTKIKTHYELKLNKKTNIRGYEIGVPEWKPYTVQEGETWIITEHKINKVRNRGIDVNFGMGEGVNIPFEMFKVTEVKTKIIENFGRKVIQK